MERSEMRDLALEYLYDRYLATEDGDDIGYVDWEKAQMQTGFSQAQLGVLFQELVDLGQADTRRPSANTMKPKDGFVWTTALGRAIVENKRSKKAPIPIPVQVIFDGFTPEGKQQYLDMLGQVSASEQAQLRELLDAFLDASRSEEDRLEQLANLTTVLQGNLPLLTWFITVAAPHTQTVLAQIIR
jgi:hypothetical protein